MIQETIRDLDADSNDFSFPRRCRHAPHVRRALGAGGATLSTQVAELTTRVRRVEQAGSVTIVPEPSRTPTAAPTDTPRPAPSSTPTRHADRGRERHARARAEQYAHTLAGPALADQNSHAHAGRNRHAGACADQYAHTLARRRTPTATVTPAAPYFTVNSAHGSM